jgi:D-arabinose 1-dehydrogenase-like Zn-dependent alcohol dehydrogenase
MPRPWRFIVKGEIVPMSFPAVLGHEAAGKVVEELQILCAGTRRILRK